MSYTKKQREYYNEQRAQTCEALGIDKNQYNWFRRKGNNLHKLYEDECNGLFETEEEYEKITDAFELEIKMRATFLGLNVYFQRDPRGATVYLDKEPIPENNYTRAHCIL